MYNYIHTSISILKHLVRTKDRAQHHVRLSQGRLKRRSDTKCDIIIEHLSHASFMKLNKNVRRMKREGARRKYRMVDSTEVSLREPMNLAWNEMWKTYRIKVPCNFTRTKESSAKWNVKWSLNETVLLE